MKAKKLTLAQKQLLQEIASGAEVRLNIYDDIILHNAKDKDYFKKGTALELAAVGLLQKHNGAPHYTITQRGLDSIKKPAAAEEKEVQDVAETPQEINEEKVG